MSSLTPPFWTDTYEPALNEIPQENIRESFSSIQSTGLNALIHGPKGIGKTASVNAFGDQAHENTDTGFVILNAADFFALSKSDLANHDEFGRFISAKQKRNSSKADLFNHVLKETAANTPVNAEYQTIVIDNASHMRIDFQQALRRVMETHDSTTRFILITRSASTIIDPIQSRCHLLPMKPPKYDAINSILTDIAIEENIDHVPAGMEFVVGRSNGNIRKAITELQLIATAHDSITPSNAHETLSTNTVNSEFEAIWTAINSNKYDTARGKLDTLLIDHGLTGNEILQRLHDEFQMRVPEKTATRLAPIAAETDTALQAGTDDRTQLMNYLTTTGVILDKEPVE